MPTMFDRYENSPAASLPAWSTYWAPSGGCNGRTVYYSSPITFTGCPTNVKDWYNEKEVRVIKDPQNRKGFRGPGASPPYRYTPYSIYKTTTSEVLIRRLAATAGSVVYYQYGSVPRVNNVCTAVIGKVEKTGPHYSKWTTVNKIGDYAGSTYTVNGFDAQEISDAISNVTNKAALDSLTSYDLLTDIAELHQIPSAVRSTSRSILQILRAMQRAYGRGIYKNIDPSFLRIGSKYFGLWHLFNTRPKELIRSGNKFVAGLGNLWMSYRYSIMPLVYSYRDICKTVNRSHDVTTRGFETISPRDLGVSLPPSSTQYKKVEYSGSITIRASVFQSFSSTELARLSGLGSNLLTTAWELIPMSFVADWFVNVGDYIARRCGSTWAAKRWACCSRRDNYTKSTYVHLPNQDQSITIGVKTPLNWVGALPPSEPNVIIPNPMGDYLGKVETVDSYARWLFDVTSVPLQLRPSMNWRRYVDSSVLALNLLRSFIRSFRS